MTIRNTLLGISLLVLFAGKSLAGGQSVSTTAGNWQATFSEPTNRYGHGVLGDTPEWGQLCLSGPAAEGCVTLPDNRVFEDLAPRLADVDLDGRLDAVVVEADNRLGASLVVYQLEPDGSLKRIANDPIGTRFRWLAPIGIADLDDDGRVEIAYVDRPHLAKVLRIFRFDNDQLTQVASKPGFSNHRIGDAFIVGGLRRCEGKPVELITADSSWSQVLASRFEGGKLTTRVVDLVLDVADFEGHLTCR